MVLIPLQASYVALGVIMSLMSFLHYRNNGSYLTATPPLAGLIFMISYAGCLFVPYVGSPFFYRCTMFVFLVLITISGVLKHLLAKDKSAYWSEKSRWYAILINTYGVVLTAAALGGKHRTRRLKTIPAVRLGA